MDRKEPDPVEQEIAEQHAHSERVLARVERVLRDAAHLLSQAKRDAATIDAYTQAERERTR